MRPRTAAPSARSTPVIPAAPQGHPRAPPLRTPSSSDSRPCSGSRRRARCRATASGSTWRSRKSGCSPDAGTRRLIPCPRLMTRNLSPQASKSIARWTRAGENVVADDKPSLHRCSPRWSSPTDRTLQPPAELSRGLATRLRQPDPANGRKESRVGPDAVKGPIDVQEHQARRSTVERRLEMSKRRITLAELGVGSSEVQRRDDIWSRNAS